MRHTRVARHAYTPVAGAWAPRCLGVPLPCPPAHDPPTVAPVAHDGAPHARGLTGHARPRAPPSAQRSAAGAQCSWAVLSGHPPLRGRDEERRTLDGLLNAIRAGESRALVVHGEPGVGKTALLDHLVARASGCRVARAAGVQSEMELAFAGLHQLCAPMMDRLDQLPGPQFSALGAAFGMRRGDAPDHFLVGLAVLSMLSDVAEEQPLICVVDDAQWLDRASAQVLAFVGRRMLAESVGLVFAVREPGAELTGLPQLAVEGLADDDARSLLDSVVDGPLDRPVRDRIVAETRGNPLALLELPHVLTPAELAGGFALPDTLALPGRIEEGFRRRLEVLSADRQRLLLIAAAEPVGDPVLVWRAARRLGIDADFSAPRDMAGLIEFGAQVRFRHPLVRSAVYQAASAEERRSVHGALARATDPEVDPDRRAWHRAHATPGHDEDVAAELERSARRAFTRGGVAAAAAFLDRGTALTPDPARRAERALNAAHAKHLAGAPDDALRLLATAAAGPLDELHHARVDLLRGQIVSAVSRGSDAPPLLLKAARRLELLDVPLARQTYLEAFSAAVFAGRLATGGGLREVAEAVRAAPPAPQPERASDLLLDGLALTITEGYATGAPILKRALAAGDGETNSITAQVSWLWLASQAATHVWDYDRWHDLASRQVGLARQSGALSTLPTALVSRIGLHLLAGELSEAAGLIEEAAAVTEANGRHLALYSALPLAAWRGNEADVSRLIETTTSEVVARGGGIGLSIIHWASAVLYNGLGRYDDALRAATRAVGYPHDGFWALSELVEAATLSGKAGPGHDALARLSEMTRASGTDWALGIAARSRALLSEGQDAERLYREAIDRLGNTRVRVELARAHLLYGEWLRRRRRRLDAREQLRAAHEMLAAMGVDAFAQRARRELLATGESARKRSVETAGQLTPREAQIAQFAREGLSNPDIGARLFISSRTVEYHMRKVFTKLGISSRKELAAALTDAPLADAAASV
jgi:DNA-binding CsgD family transcriptional regulator